MRNRISFVTTARHLVARFFGAVVAPGQLPDLVLATTYLNSAEQSLFLNMHPADQIHSLDLCSRLRRDGYADRDLLRAALLHDVGKSGARLGLVHRVVFTLMSLFVPPVALWVSRPTVGGWRRPFFVAGHHAEIGAAAVEQSGSSSAVVALIRHHGSGQRGTLIEILDRYDMGLEDRPGSC